VNVDFNAHGKDLIKKMRSTCKRTWLVVANAKRWCPMCVEVKKNVVKVNGGKADELGQNLEIKWPVPKNGRWNDIHIV